MIGIAMYTTILTLYKQGMSQRKIAKTINTHRSTVNKIIKKYESSKIEVPIPYQRSSLTGSWHEEIIDLMSKRKVLKLNKPDIIILKNKSRYYGSLNNRRKI